jgi:DNA-directed RNA polymerase specialized sigma24 family protein
LANVLLQHDVLGHSVPEISELYGMKISAVQSRLSRARKEFVRRSSATIASI